MIFHIFLKNCDVCHSHHLFVSFFKVDVAEVMYIVKELWRGRSARDQSIEHVGRGMWRSVKELILVRYWFSFSFCHLNYLLALMDFLGQSSENNVTFWRFYAVTLVIFT